MYLQEANTGVVNEHVVSTCVYEVSKHSSYQWGENLILKYGKTKCENTLERTRPPVAVIRVAYLGLNVLCADFENGYKLKGNRVKPRHAKFDTYK